jgi:hypothetical protein
LAVGYWLLAIGYWLLAIGYWLLAIGSVVVGAGVARPSFRALNRRATNSQQLIANS